MLTRFGPFVLALLLSALALSHLPDSYAATEIPGKAVYLQNAATATGAGVVLDTYNFHTLTIDVSGTFVGTIVFEADYGSGMKALTCFDLSASPTGVTSTTTTGTWRCNVSSTLKAQARISLYTSGSITVFGTLETGGSVRADSGGGGSGGGTGANVGSAVGSSTHNKILYSDNAGLLQELPLADGQVPTASNGSIVAGTIDISNTVVILTNKTIDCEATGNVCSIPIKKWLPAAGCNNATAGTVWDLPTSTPAVPTCVTGANIQKGVLAYADTSGGFSAQITDALPSDWTTTGGVDAKILWTTSATSGNAKWSLSTACTDVAATVTDDPSFNAANTVTTAAPGVASKVQTSSITGLTLTGCTTATNMLLHLKLFRDGNDAADTIGATANVIGVLLTYRRAI